MSMQNQMSKTVLLTPLMSVPQKSIPSAVVYCYCAWYTFSAEQTLTWNSPTFASSGSCFYKKNQRNLKNDTKVFFINKRWFQDPQQIVL